ncbi:flagellar basal body-associated FliL family protein [Dactylosporangium sp. AC04546]|uniref:flagellar basal body-associated FliL family protein n=1 Tax=Dactylosporangium sp. AC04546 TaxID=2862460 RepID=UPI002E7BE9D4|nr:flagellar basal body-associated FliL family protein [Dactylosporangium sp. AC04546]WVK82656.1 flagellar basal body-associated FliL family protein [Dactylosporangium sp. AC04546]
MAKDDKTTDEAAPAKGSKKKLIMIIAVVLAALIGGGAGGYLMFKPNSAAAEKEPEPTPGTVVVLDAITINLADGHYLKLKLSLQATTDAAEEPDGSKALDIAIDLYSNRKESELLTNEARERSKAELKEKIVKAYTEEKTKLIMDVYFTTFVIQ